MSKKTKEFVHMIWMGCCSVCFIIGVVPNNYSWSGIVAFIFAVAGLSVLAVGMVVETILYFKSKKSNQ